LQFPGPFGAGGVFPFFALFLEARPEGLHVALEICRLMVFGAILRVGDYELEIERFDLGVAWFAWSWVFVLGQSEFGR
jgi:hypothetical protein